jgi:hypothetical protein
MRYRRGNEMLVVRQMDKLADYGFCRVTRKKNDHGFDMWVRDVKITGYADEYRFSLIVNPMGYHTENVLIQCVDIEKKVEDIVHEADVDERDVFTFDEEFPVDLLVEMVAAGVVKYVPDMGTRERVA